MAPAAVLVPLIDRDSQLHLVLTRRTETLRDHPGQISFPGGRIEEGDEGPGAAALRETAEELGVAPESVDLIGYLPTQPVISGYAVTPVVGFIAPDASLRPDPVEVASVIEVPLDFFLRRSNEKWGWRTVAAIDFRVVEYRFGDERIWGATAQIINSLVEVIS
jgi:8-oxo-dGTP pyrophosphatase MutT (NUDIX family)